MAAEDITNLIPQTRRAIDGPAATSPSAPSTSLGDSEVKALIADAMGEVILLTGGLFGHELVVDDRDSTYMAPIEWSVDPALTEPEKVVITAQAAINYFFHKLKDVKVAETMRDEGSEWSYTLSATLLKDQMKFLVAARDRAIDAVSVNTEIATYSSFLHTRDLWAASLVEPYVHGANLGGQFLIQ